MTVHIAITGQAKTRQVERKMLAAVAGGLGKDMKAALGRAVAPLQPAVKAEAEATMPSGYGPVLSADIRVRSKLRSSASTADAVLRVGAKGRMLRRINAGRLRHPLYGNKNHWFDQSVRPGVVDRPVERLQPGIRAEFEQVVADVAKRMT